MMKKLLAALALSALALPLSISANEGPDAPKDDAVLTEPVPFAAAVKKDGKWGAVNEKGIIIIPFSYDKEGVSLTDASKQEEDLDGEGRKNLIEVQKGKLRGFYNREGKVIVPISYENRSIWKEGALAIQESEKKVTFYRMDGTKIIDKTYEQVSDFQNGMSIVKENGKYGYLSLDGKEIAPVYQEARYFEDGLAPIREKGKWGVIDTAGNMVVQPSYKDAGPIYSEGLLAVKNGKDLWGFIDKTGSEAVEPAYKEVIPVFTEGYTAVENDDKLWGFINTKGEVTAKPQFKAVLTEFSEGLAGVKTPDGNGYAEPDGNIAFMADYNQLYPFEDGIAEVRDGQVTEVRERSGFPISIGIGWGWGHWFHGHHHHHHHRHSGWGIGIGIPIWDPWGYGDETVPTVQVKRGYIDNTGKVIASPSNDRVFEATDQGILIRNEGKYGWVNRKGIFTAHSVYKSLIPVEEDGLLLAQNDDKKWGLLSMADGTEVVPMMYENLYSIGNGFYSYKVKSDWGILSKDGSLVTDPVFRGVAACGDGLIPVKTKEGWKYVDTAGKDAIILKEEASDVTSFKEGRAGVKVKGKWGLIDKTGRFLVKPSYDDIEIL